MSISQHRPRRDRLRQMATGGTASIGAATIATNVLRIISSMTLTRLLDAHAYGVVGVIVSLAYMIAMLSEIGVYTFIVRHPEGDDDAFRDQIWTIKLIRAFALTAVMILIAKPTGAFLGKAELVPVIMVWSANFIFDGLSSLAFATAVRQQKLWRLALLDLSNNVSQFLISVVAAFILRSYWAMIIGILGGSAIRMAMSYILFPGSWRRWRISRPRARELWTFSRYIALSSILSLLIMQSDKVVLARLMPLATYGLYAIAVTLAAAPASVATPYATRVLFAIYSQTARTKRAALAKVIYPARRKVVLLYMAGVGAMIGGAPLLIGLLYDPRYRGVIPFLQLISISAMLRLPSLAANQALLAIGQTRSTLIANVFRIAWLASGGAVGLWTGDILLLIAIVGTVEVPGLLCFWWNLHRALLLDWKEEGYGLIAGALGITCGALLSHGVLTLFPSL